LAEVVNGIPRFQHRLDSRSFLERARAHLRTFDDHREVASLFYAALELRFGIEARLYEYIDATCQSLGVLSEERKEYAGTLLLKRLLRLDSDAGKEMTITIGDGSGVGVSLAYTPVTSVLAQMHGQLGGMMHVTFFRQNQDWSALAPTGAYGRQSLVFYRRFLGEVDDRVPKLCAPILRIGYMAAGMLAVIAISLIPVAVAHASVGTYSNAALADKALTYVGGSGTAACDAGLSRRRTCCPCSQ